jgi:HEAT repeat protein
VQELFAQIVLLAGDHRGNYAPGSERHARVELVQRGAEALSFLQAKAKATNPNWKERVLAEVMIGRITQPRTYDTLEKATRDYIRAYDNVEDAEEAAAKGKKRPDPQPRVIRLNLPIEPLPGLNHKAAIPFLIDKLLLGAHLEKQFAIALLGQMKAREAFEPLVEVVHKDRHILVGYALVALQRLGDKRVIFLVQEIAEKNILADPSGYNAEEREQAIKMLGELGHTSVVPTLERIAREDQFTSVRVSAGLAVEAIRQREPRKGQQ